MKMMEKLLEKKKQDGKQLDPMYKDSKMSMLKALRDEMSGMMKGDLEGQKMQEVKVASDSKEGLEQGLDKAKDLLGSQEDSEEEESEMQSNPSEELKELAQNASAEDLNKMIKQLEDLKQQKMGM